MGQPQTDKTGQIVKKNESAEPTIVDLVKKMGPEIARALPSHVTPDRMTRIVLTAVRVNPELARCTAGSFLGCVMQCAQLGLEPNTPLQHAFLIPRRNKKNRNGQKDCTLIIGYQGYIELAMRSPRVRNIYGYAVREGDEFEYELGLDPKLKHVPGNGVDGKSREDGKITHAYAVAKLENADPAFVVLTRAEIDARRKRGGDKSFSPWDTDYEAMALKSGVRALWKWLPKTAEGARADAIEVATEQGKPQMAAFDPDITAALENQGMLTADSESKAVDESEPSSPDEQDEAVEAATTDEPEPDDVDPNTGEVVPSQEELDKAHEEQGEMKV